MLSSAAYIRQASTVAITRVPGQEVRQDACPVVGHQDAYLEVVILLAVLDAFLAVVNLGAYLEVATPALLLVASPVEEVSDPGFACCFVAEVYFDFLPLVLQVLVYFDFLPLILHVLVPAVSVVLLSPLTSVPVHPYAAPPQVHRHQSSMPL